MAATCVGTCWRCGASASSAIMLLAWGYSRLVAGSEALADVGAVSFSALATLVPALAFAVWRPQTPARAVVAGIVAGFCRVVLGAARTDRVCATWESPAWLSQGPFGIAALSPNGLFELTGWSRLGRAVGASLFVGTLATLLVAAWAP
jgi:Na+/proline symporter